MPMVIRHAPVVLGGAAAGAGIWLILRAPDLIAFGVTLWLIMAVVVLWRPEAVVSLVALAVPAASFHQSLVASTPLGNLTLVQALTFSLALFFGMVRPRQATEGLTSPLGVVGGTFGIAGVISALANGSFSSLYWVINLGGLLVAMSILLTSRYRQSPRSVDGWVISTALVVALSVLIEQALGAHVAWVPTEAAKVDVLQFRPSGTAGNALLAGAVCAVVFALALSWETRGAKLFLLVLTGVFAMAGFATLSRSAIVAMIAVAVVVAFRGAGAARSQRFIRAAVITIGLPALAWLWLGASNLVANRLGGQTFGGRSDSQRWFSLSYAFDLLRENPWFGVGLGGFKRMTQHGVFRGSLATADNFLLTLLVELGVLGLLVICVTVWVVTTARKRMREHGQAPGSVLALVALVVTALFFDAFYHDPMILLLAVAILKATSPASTGDVNDQGGSDARHHSMGEITTSASGRGAARPATGSPVWAAMNP